MHLLKVTCQNLISWKTKSICCLDSCWNENKIAKREERRIAATTRLFYKNAVLIENRFRKSLKNTMALPHADIRDTKGQKPPKMAI